MTHWDDKDVDRNAITDKLGTSQQNVAGMVYATKNTARAYNELVEAGTALGQIPPWFMRPSGDNAVTTSPLTPPSTP